MAGKMMGSKGMRSALVKGHSPMPHKNPRSAHIREAQGGFIISKQGGDGAEPFGSTDHVAPNIDAAMTAAREHLGGAGGEMADPADPNEPAEAAPAVAASQAPGDAKAGPSKIKKRMKSETY